MVDLRVKHSVDVVHPLLAVYIPFMFLYTVAVVMVAGAFATYDIQIFPPFFWVILLLAGASESVTSNLLSRERISGILPRVRELVVVLAVSLGLILLFFGDVTAGDIDLSRFNIWVSLIVVLAQWLITLQIHNKLRDRELFLSFFQGKEQRAFQDIYATYNHEGGKAYTAMKSVRKHVFGYIVVGFIVLVLVTWAVRMPITGGAAIIVFLFFSSFFLIAALIERYLDMQRALLAGHVVTRPQARRKNAAMILIFAVAALIAFPVAGRRALLPTSYLVALGDWLAGLGTRELPPPAAPRPDLGTQPPAEDPFGRMSDIREMLGDRGNGTDIARYVGYALLGLLGAGFLAFLLLPLFRMKASGNDIRRALRRSMRSLAHGIRSTWLALVVALRRAVSHGKHLGGVIAKRRGATGDATPGRSGAAARRAEMSRQERKIHGRVLKAFMKFTRWARRHEVVFDPSIGPREFSELVGDRVPARMDECLEIAEIFEEIVFSNHDINDELQNRYHDKVARVVRSR